MLAGFIWGILHFPLGQVYYLSVVQVLIEYPIAYTFAGAAGLMASNVQKGYVDDNTKQIRKSIVFGALIGALSRYFGILLQEWFSGERMHYGDESLALFFRNEWCQRVEYSYCNDHRFIRDPTNDSFDFCAR